ncbi:unnamed protein product, partial [Closterium sp. NIES-53]
AATARARVARVVEVAVVVVEVAVGAVVGAAVEVVEAVEVVAAVGLVAAVGALVAAVEAAQGVPAMEAVGLVVVGLDLGVEALVVVSDSSSSVGARPSRPSSSGDCYRCVPPDPGIAAAALGASASGTPPGTAPAEALHTFVNGNEVLAPPSLGQRRRLGRMYGSSGRPSTVGELLDRLRRAAGDHCDVAVDQGD